MEHDFTSGSVWKKLFLFAVPIFGANLLQALYGTVDLFVVGLFADASAVSAVSTGSMMMQTITGIITGLTMGCTVLLGQNIGKKDEAAKRADSRLCTLAVCHGGNPSRSDRCCIGSRNRICYKCAGGSIFPDDRLYPYLRNRYHLYRHV